MSALIAAALSYIGGDLLIAVLARLGIGGAKAAAAKEVLPIVARIAKRMREKKAHAPENEHGAYQAVIDELNGAHQSIQGGWFE